MQALTTAPLHLPTGATFDVSLRFLHECPWERLEQLRASPPIHLSADPILSLLPSLVLRMLEYGSSAKLPFLAIARLLKALAQ